MCEQLVISCAPSPTSPHRLHPIRISSGIYCAMPGLAAPWPHNYMLILFASEFALCFLQLDQLSAEKAKLHKEKVDLENQLEAEQVCLTQHSKPGTCMSYDNCQQVSAAYQLPAGCNP